MYGICEVVQAFCRMSAVWGGTFILNRTVTKLRKTMEHVDSCTTPPPADDSNIIISTSTSSNCNNSRSSSNTSFGSSITIQESEGRSIQCQAFVCSASYWPGTPRSGMVKVECMSIWLGIPLPLTQSIAIIPPHSSFKQANDEQVDLNNPFVVHISQTGPSSNASPTGSSVVNIATRMLLDSVGDLSSESSLKDISNPKIKQASELMDNVIKLLQCSIIVGENGVGPEELSRVVVMKAVYDVQSSTDLIRRSFPTGVEVCYESEPLSLTLNSEYNEAKRIFERIFPDLEFSLQSLDREGTLSNVLEEDDEVSFLESALHSIQNIPNDS